MLLRVKPSEDLLSDIFGDVPQLQAYLMDGTRFNPAFISQQMRCNGTYLRRAYNGIYEMFVNKEEFLVVRNAEKVLCRVYPLANIRFPVYLAYAASELRQPKRINFMTGEVNCPEDLANLVEKYGLKRVEKNIEIKSFR